MRRVSLISVLAFLFVSILALAQQQTVTTGSIEGVVVSADGGTPISGAQVELSGGPVPVRPAGVPPANLSAVRDAILSSPTVITGADGRFSFKNLAAASYGLTATATGFVRQQYGQIALHGGPERFINLAAGQAVNDVAIRLTTTGTVRGRITDELDQPAAKAPVRLVRIMYGPLGNSLATGGEGSADDRGEFRIFGVTPGRYYLVAGTPPGPRPAGPNFTYVFYPNSPEVDQATLLEVKSGGEMTVDMRVGLQNQTYRVRGRIMVSPGTPLPSVRITMLSVSRSWNPSRVIGAKVVDPATGAFEFQDVSPGEYIVQAQAQDPPQPSGRTLNLTAMVTTTQLAERTTVRVIDKDVENVAIVLEKAIMTTGRVTVEGKSIVPPGALDGMRLVFSPQAPSPTDEERPAASPTKPSSSFEVGLREGKFRVDVVPVPPGLYVKSIDYGGTNILGKLYDFTASGVATFNVTIRAGTAQLDGTVTNVKSPQSAQQMPVVLIPIDHGRMDLSRTVYTDQNGHFTFPEVPPGDYKVFCWEAANMGDAYDSDFMKLYENQVPVTHVAEASNQTISVRMFPAP